MTTLPNIDITKLSEEQLNVLSNECRKEKAIRQSLKPEENLEKSIKKTYDVYLSIYKKGKNPSHDLFGVTGWDFDTFRKFMEDKYKGKQIKKPKRLSLIYIDNILKEKEEEWRKANNKTLNVFCKVCNRYYIGKHVCDA